jgi:hypothetical protein
MTPWYKIEPTTLLNLHEKKKEPSRKTYPVLMPEECYSHFIQTLQNFGEIPTYPLFSMDLQSSDLTLERKVRLRGPKPLTCVIRTSPQIEDYLAELTARNRKLVAVNLFDRLALDFSQRVAWRMFGCASAEKPHFILTGSHPDDWPSSSADTLCRLLIGPWTAEIRFWFNPFAQTA